MNFDWAFGQSFQKLLEKSYTYVSNLGDTFMWSGYFSTDNYWMKILDQWEGLQAKKVLSEARQTAKA